MEVLRFVAEPVNHQLVIDLPPSLDHQRLEVIVKPAADNVSPVVSRGRRKPSPLLAGSVILADDLIAPAVIEEDWDALK